MAGKATVQAQDRITQTELGALAYMDAAANAMARGFQKRIAAGASIEGGAFGFTPFTTPEEERGNGGETAFTLFDVGTPFGTLTIRRDSRAAA